MAEKVAPLGIRPSGVDLDASKSRAEVELFGHVTLVEGYALPNFTGCYALVALRDTPSHRSGTIIRGSNGGCRSNTSQRVAHCDLAPVE
jgi:hypothetical protein